MSDITPELVRIAKALEKSNELVEKLIPIHEQGLATNIKWVDYNINHDEIMAEIQIGKATLLMDRLVERALAKLKEKS